MSSKSNRQESVAEDSPPLLQRRSFLMFLCAILCLQFLDTEALAVPACPEPVLYRQPDGTTFRARKVGDEYRHVIETDAGYTVIKDAGSGVWFYAKRGDKGKLEKSPFPVGRISPLGVGIRKHLRPAKLGRQKKISAQPDLKSASSVPYSSAKDASQTAAPGTSQPTGTPTALKNLVILACFSDHTSIFTQSDFDALFNEIGYSTDGAYGSVRDYYREASHGQAEIDSTVADWVVLPYEEAYYGANDENGNDVRPQEMAEDAIAALDDTGFDFSPYDGDGDGYVDMLTFIHSGLGEEYSANPDECIWSHKGTLWPHVTVDGVTISQYATAPERRYSGTSIIRIGVICHEMGHLLELPDLYDTDYSSSGIGVWGVMAAGSWGGDTYSAERPVHFCAWSKIKVGWIIPTEIDASDSPVTVPQIEKTTSPVICKISAEMGDGEHLLIENRQKRSYDARLPAGGLLIWHVDDNKSDNDDEADHYMVALLQADGNRDLENGSDKGDAGDPFPGSTTNRSLTPDTNPNSDSYFNGDTHISIKNISDPGDEMTFSLSTLIDIYTEDFSGGLPTDWTVVDGYSDGYTWTDQNPAGRTNSNWSGTFMIADSAWAGLRWMDEELISPVLDCSNYVHTRIQFSHYFRARRDQTGDVDIRVNGGEWQNIARYVTADDEGLKDIDISSYADGKASVQIRWHFYNARWDRYWGIDNVALRGMPPVNDLPEISITSISQRPDGSGYLEVTFTGTDPEDDPATWVSSDCQFAPSPYSEWQPLSFDTADPAHTAQEPIPFTSTGASFVAVIDASAWNGAYKIKLRVSDGTNQSLTELSDKFVVDNTAAEVSVATHLVGSAPQSGDTAVTAGSSWYDLNPGTTWFSLKVNDTTWSEAIDGSPMGSSTQSITFDSLTIDGDDYVTARSHHIDEYGNESEESISSQYYVTPMVPSVPQVETPTPNSLVVAIVPNPGETGDADYAVSCTTTKKYVDFATGTFVDSAVWGKHSQWNGDDGVTVTGLASKTTYSFRVMAANPLDRLARSGYSDTASATTSNTFPNPPVGVGISPEAPISTDELLCSVTPANPPDADEGDAVTYLYTWSCPGKTDIVHGPTAELTDTLPASHTEKGDTWTCTVQAYDSFDYSEPVISAERPIRNSPPFAPEEIVLSPDAPKTGNDLLCTVTPANPSDPDSADTVTYRYTWSCPGKSDVVHGPKSETSDALSSALTEKGHVWTCRVEAYDGEDWSPSLSESATIANTPPNQPHAVVITPETPQTADDLLCTVTPADPPDADPNETTAYIYTWSCPGKDGVINGPKTETTDTLGSSLTDKGDVWTCSGQAFDGSDYSEPLAASQTIANTAPNPPSQLTLSPETPISTDDLTCSVTPAATPDPDPGDTISYKYTWSNGAETVVAGPKDSLTDVLPAASTSQGETWTCTVEAFDGEAYSPGVEVSASVGNASPAAPTIVSISPSAPYTDDALVCTIQPANPPDPDEGDTVLYQFTWSCPEQESIVAGPTDSLSDTLPSSNTAKGDVWTCTVVATDGEATSDEVSSSVAILNSPPTLEVTGDTIVYEFSPLELTVTASDVDGDPLALSCQGAPDEATFTDHADGSGTFQWIANSTGTYDLILIADDAEDQTTEPVSITVAPTEFRIVYIGLEPILSEERRLAITWFGIPGTVYSVFRSDDLATWECVACELALPPGSEQGDWLSYREELNASSAPFFYRVSME